MTGKRNFFSLKSLLCLFIAFGLLTGIAYAASKTLLVPQQEQQYTYTCWASVGSMISAFFKGNTTNYETSILNYVKPGVNGNDPAAMGTVQDTKTGVQYITGIAGSVQASALSYTAVKYQINGNGPISAACVYLYGGHMLALKGYNDDVTQDVLYNDPADGLGHRCSYSYMINTFGWNNSAFWK
ncbi:MAG: papain-like cysteine protease family protein [Bacillota bacterium]